jgi:hypothetical protein
MAKYQAEAAVLPARFIQTGAAEHTVIQAVVGSQTLGISGASQKDARSDVGNLNHADAGDPCLVYDGTGVDTDRACFLELGGTVTGGAPLMPDANGKGVIATAGEYYGALAGSDGVAGNIIEVQPVLSGIMSSDTPLVVTKTADYTVLTTDSGRTFETTAAAGPVTFSLPAAVAGLKYRFLVGAAQELRIDPDGTETISLPSTGVAGAAGKYLTANAAGETVDVQCAVDGTWAVFGFTGTWTAEA